MHSFRLSLVPMMLVISACSSMNLERNPAMDAEGEANYTAKECMSREEFASFYGEDDGQRGQLTFPASLSLSFKPGKQIKVLPNTDVSFPLKGERLTCYLQDAELERTKRPLNRVHETPERVMTKQGLFVSQGRDVNFKDILEGRYQLDAGGDYKPSIAFSFGQVGYLENVDLVCYATSDQDNLWYDNTDRIDIFDGLSELFDVCVPPVKQIETFERANRTTTS